MTLTFLMVPMGLSLLGCDKKGTCLQQGGGLKKDDAQTLCVVGIQKNGCAGESTFTAEDNAAGIAHCKALGFTHAVGYAKGRMTEAEYVDADLAKGNLAVFSKN